MRNPYDGGQAFPRAGYSGSIPTEGMTLRDWFAGQALAGMMANPHIREIRDSDIWRAAFYHADAMIKIREVKP